MSGKLKLTWLDTVNGKRKYRILSAAPDENVEFQYELDQFDQKEKGKAIKVYFRIKSRPEGTWYVDLIGTTVKDLQFGWGWTPTRLEGIVFTTPARAIQYIKEYGDEMYQWYVDCMADLEERSKKWLKESEEEKEEEKE